MNQEELLHEEQLRMELEAQDVRQSKSFRDTENAKSKGLFDEAPYGQALIQAYYQPIKDKLDEYYSNEYQGHTGKTQRYLKYLCSDTAQLAYIMLQTLTRRLAQRSNQVKTATMAKSIVTQLKISHKYESAKETNPKLIAYLGSEYRRASAHRKRVLIEKHLDSFVISDKVVDSSVSVLSEQVRAGALLLDIVIKSGANLLEQKKLWNKRIDRYPSYYISFTREVFDIIMDKSFIPTTLALYPPMIVSPKDWTSFNSGGYYTVDFPFIRFKHFALKKKMIGDDLSKAMGVINKLQHTAWRNNSRVVDIIKYVYDLNLIDPKSPPTLPNLYGGIPVSTPSNIKELMDWKIYNENPTPAEKKEWVIWNKRREHIQIGLDGEHGRRLLHLMTMGVVYKMKKYSKFYFPHSLDYRGRVYPLVDFFNPQSKGYVKAMLEFADGQILDDVGVYWLKVHTANTYGMDKEPFSDRIKWVDDNMEMILSVARSPLLHKSSWVWSDSPYEFLAACMACEDYTNGKEVHLPIQLDAVNSGVQMYSGLLRDKSGAQSTCVIGDVRSDLYAEVAAAVEYKLINKQYPAYFTYTDKEDKEVVVSTSEEATSMIGNFTRKMTKPNVMTVPYSVSMRGMSQQNWDIMNEMTLSGKNFWKGDAWVVNKIWTQLVHESIFDIVKGARAGQEYLKEVARGLTDVAMWHTPIYNIPVIQPAYKSILRRVRTLLGTLTIVERTTDLKKQKQLSSIAANFIHSIDATILMYVVEHSTKSIGTIHDCFLVHPNQGDEVRMLYKEGYVRVMEADPLKMFQKELDPKRKVEIPYVGDLDLQEVYDSSYIIS